MALKQNKIFNFTRGEMQIKTKVRYNSHLSGWQKFKTLNSTGSLEKKALLYVAS